MYYRLKHLPELRDVSRNDARRIVNFVGRRYKFDRRLWLSALLIVPPMLSAWLVADHYFSDRFILRSCMMAAGIFCGMALSRVAQINLFLRDRIREVKSDPQQLHAALYDESHLVGGVDAIVTIAFVALVLAAFALIITGNS